MLAKSVKSKIVFVFYANYIITSDFNLKAYLNPQRVMQ